VSSYNEPLITAEWAVEVFRQARAQGLRTAFVSNGNSTPRALEFLRPHLDAIEDRLEGDARSNLPPAGGTLEATLSTIRSAYEMGLWSRS